MKIAICDDSSIDRGIISDFLNMYMTENPVSAVLAEYETGEALLYDIEDGCYYDMIFLDIQMLPSDGMQIALKLRQLDYKGKIIFSTVDPGFAIASYDVEASGYLLKPYDYTKMSRLLDRTFERINTGMFRFTLRNTVYNIPYGEIVFVESSNNVCILHRSNGTSYTIYQKLCDIEKQLDDARFLRCHQSYIVNMSYIAKADKQFEMTTGDFVLIRQRNLKELRGTYREYVERNKNSADKMTGNEEK